MTEEKKTEITTAVDDCWNRIGVWRQGTERCPELVSVIHCRNCPVYSFTGRRLLDRLAPEDYRKEWTSVISKSLSETTVRDLTAFIFRTGGEWLALSAKLIQEVVDISVIHSLPHRNSSILRGVVNIRGKLELCFSIGALLDIERFEKTEENKKYVSPPRLVVAAREGQRLVFPVSEVYGAFRYADSMLQSLPVTVSGSKAAFTRGIIGMQDFDVGFLDDRILFQELMRNTA